MAKETVKRRSPGGIALSVITGLIAVFALTNIICHAVVWESVSFWTMFAVNCMLVLLSAGALVGDFPILYLPVAVCSFVLASLTNNIGTTLFNFTFYAVGILAAFACVLGCVLCVRGRVAPKRVCVLFMVPVLLFLAVFGAVWGVSTLSADGTEEAGREIWSVPDKFDEEACPQEGTLEKISYATKAYATDSRDVEKSAYVYLPYGYDEGVSYNILYLLHGTGDDEAYWLSENTYNKLMLDNMIYHGVISPLIVVTPTFYVEDDCLDSLDDLTYSFKYEVRNDLVPAVEAAYSTYAKECTDEAFVASRTHRAFAGLSRGAVTTLRSVFNGCLDWFSSFGTFSASRTGADYFQENIQSEEMADYSIDYWYVASGAFDFGLASQIQDYSAVLEVEPRLEEGVNTSFDVFPMRYHSMGNWHLALYNFLQKIF